MIRFGRFDEVLEVNNRPNERFDGGMWDFAQGYARLRMGEADFARLYLERVKKAASDTTKQIFGDIKSGFATCCGGNIRRGKFICKQEIYNQRLCPLKEPLPWISLRWDEPEPFPFAARHWLGAALLEAKRYADAERVYRRY
ncbi:MAG: hypothetical protein R3B93_15885 [Bacteroidia bacterium]